jgi:hypothetical protein
MLCRNTDSRLEITFSFPVAITRIWRQGSIKCVTSHVLVAKVKFSGRKLPPYISHMWFRHVAVTCVQSAPMPWQWRGSMPTSSWLRPWQSRPARGWWRRAGRAYWTAHTLQGACGQRHAETAVIFLATATHHTWEERIVLVSIHLFLWPRIHLNNTF